MAVVVNEVTGNSLPPGHLPGEAALHHTTPSSSRPRHWSELRALVAAQLPALSAPPPGAAGLCAICLGPVRRGSSHCFQCRMHAQCAGDALADVVLPVAYALKGSQHAACLWQYKSIHHDAAAPAASSAAVRLLALLLLFLRDHGHCAWRSVGWTGPTHLAVVPSGRGRPGPHPLRTLIAPYLTRPWAELSAEPDHQRVRELDPGRFEAGPVPGARVLLIDDTWTTGASAQSAAMALRRAGADGVVTVVIGRHVSPPAELAAFSPAAMPLRPEVCPAHAIAGGPAAAQARHPRTLS